MSVPQQQFQPQQQQAPGLNADLILEDPKAWQQQFAAAVAVSQQQQIAAVAAPVLQQQAETSRWMSQQDDKRKEIWSKYGHEVEQLVSQIPTGYRTKAMWDKAADMVKAEHIDELAEARAQERMAAMRGTDTVGSDYRDGMPTSRDGSTELWAEVEKNVYGKHMLATVGRAGIVEHCRAEGMKLEDYLKTISKSRTRLPGPGQEGVFWTELVED